MLQRQALSKRNNALSFKTQFKQSSTTWNVFGVKLPRVFVMIMCILIMIILVLIIEISFQQMNVESNEQESSQQKKVSSKRKVSITPESFMKNGVSLDTAPLNVIPVLIFCHARPKYLTRTLQSVFNTLNTDKWNEKFVIFISQDGNHKGVERIIVKYAKQRMAYFLQFDYDSTSRKMMKGFEGESWRVYHKISAHYKWALNKLLIDLDYDRIVILEEDMEISPDFFSYFYNLSPLIDIDKSIYCISAWNDNGQKGLVKDSNKLYRTDVFPGLGWMLTQNLWKEFRFNFSLAFWDDWFRESKQTKNRSCIRPEISRTYTFGQIGSSGGWFYMEFLQKMQLNKKNIDWSKQNLDYLLNQNYDQYLKDIIQNAKKIKKTDLTPKNIKKIAKDQDCIIFYKDLQEYTRKSSVLHLMQDHKFGLPRTSYRGIVIVNWNNHRIIFAPKIIDWTPRNQYELDHHHEKDNNV